MCSMYAACAVCLVSVWYVLCVCVLCVCGVSGACVGYKNVISQQIFTEIFSK